MRFFRKPLVAKRRTSSATKKNRIEDKSPFVVVEKYTSTLVVLRFEKPTRIAREFTLILL
jgi:hypothetical protein